MATMVQRLKLYYNNKQYNRNVHIYNAYSMADIYKILRDIGSNVYGYKNKAIGRPIWFRGQGNEGYKLIPSLFRQRDSKKNQRGSYSTLSLAEEYRHQNFAARVNHLIGNESKSRVEWQELLQHHLGKTRFMDWSEAVETAIDFALEAFLDTKDTADNRYSRSNSTPGIWALDPYKLNERVYDYFAQTNEGLEMIVKSLYAFFSKIESRTLGVNIQKELKNNKPLYFNIDNNNIIDIAINGLVSVCVLDNHYHYNLNQMRNMIKQFEFNPFFYLIVRYYADALPVDVDINKTILPPIASIQPYHSERIRAQRGTFTIFPNYCRTPAAMRLKNAGMDVVPLEKQNYIKDCFCYIRMCDPVRITQDLIYAGERRPELYPDIQIYADYLETEKFHI